MLVTETGSGSATAEGYLSVADFKSEYGKRYGVLDAVPDDDIERAIRRGTQYIDNVYRNRFGGWRTFGLNQALEFPRQGVVITWGQNEWYTGLGNTRLLAASSVLSPTAVPQQVKTATFEAAKRELASPGSLTPDQTPSRRVIRQAVGPISTEYANTSDTRPTVTLIDEILAPLLSRTSAYSGALVRA